MNYNNEMKKQLENIEEGTKLLLHACCAPCSSYVIEYLSKYFYITVLYYNPNIIIIDQKYYTHGHLD